MNIRALMIPLALSLGLLSELPANADTNIEAVPTGWRLQNYINNPSGVVAWYTGSSCGSGELVFPSSATTDDKNRFWSMVMTAKATAHTIGIFYDGSGSCQITSFYEP